LIETTKPFVVHEMTCKGHSRLSVDRLHFLSNPGKEGYTYFQRKSLKWPWKWITVIGDGTIQ